MMEEKQESMDLPDECWDLIFKRLGLHQYHLDAISLVCKRFLSISSCLVHSLTISDPRIFLPHSSNMSIANFFQRFTHLKQIHVSYRFLSESDLEIITVGIARSGLKRLEEIDFFTQDKFPVECLKELGSNIKSLKTLRCRLCILTGSLLIAIANSLPRLQELDVRHHEPFLRTCVRDIAIEEISSKLKELRKITITEYPSASKNTLLAVSSSCMLLNEIDVDVKNDNVSRYGTGYALRHCSNLNSLSVSNYSADSSLSPPASSFSIENSISYARALCALEFRYSSLSDALLCSIAEAHLPLKILSFSGCRDITPSGLSILLQEYQSSLSGFEFKCSNYLTDQRMNHLSKYLHNVTHINLFGCLDLNNSTFFILARSCPLLVDIKMNKTHLGHEGDVGVDLKKNSEIQFLNACRNYCLNDETLKKIGYVCPNLQMLDLNFCWDYKSHCSSDITEEGIGEILKSCSGIRHLMVNRCKLEMIIGTDSEYSKLNIEVLEAELSKINDKGMEMIGIRCPSLLKLKLRKCPNVTTEGVKKVVEKCPKLMEIDLEGCQNVSVDVLSWMIKTRPSLRKILSPDLPFGRREKSNLFMRHGCRVYFEDFKLFERFNMLDD